MRCIEIFIDWNGKLYGSKINRNMRCIEIPIPKEGEALLNAINRNMRCIEIGQKLSELVGARED